MEGNSKSNSRQHTAGKKLSKTSLHASEGGMKIATFAQFHLRFLTEATGDVPGQASKPSNISNRNHLFLHKNDEMNFSPLMVQKKCDTSSHFSEAFCQPVSSLMFFPKCLIQIKEDHHGQACHSCTGDTLGWDGGKVTDPLSSTVGGLKATGTSVDEGHWKQMSIPWWEDGDVVNGGSCWIRQFCEPVLILSPASRWWEW